MKKLVLVLLVIVSVNSFAQTAYEKAMQKGLSLLVQNKQNEASNQFERVAANETKNWLPAYYVALANVNASYQTKDKNKLDLYLQKAEKYINRAEILATNNSEILALKGSFYTSKIASNPQENGMKLTGLTIATFQKAVALDSLNPRAHLGLLDFQHGMDQFFKKDLKPYCAKYKAILSLFDKKAEYQFAPNWGKDRVQYRVKELCGDSKGQTITVVVTGFKSNSGKLKVALFDSKQHFLVEMLQTKDAIIKDHKATVTFENIPKGNYAISCYHDDNDNDSLDKNGYGMPVEPYTFSNNAKGYMGPPTWEDTTFEIVGENIEMTLKL